MKVILTGATGTAGSEVLRQCILDPFIEQITILARRPPLDTASKVRYLEHQDFLHYDAVIELLRGHTACLWCLGAAQNEVSKSDYNTITHDYALAAADAMAVLHKPFRFCFLSGVGADTQEKSRLLFARIKGKTENALLRLENIEAYNFRPAFIHPSAPRSRVRLIERVADALAPVVYRVFPDHIIPTIDLAQAMIHVAKNGSTVHTLDNVSIQHLAHQSPRQSAGDGLHVERSVT